MKNIFKPDRAYIKSIDSNGIFTDSYDEKMPQYIVKELMK